VVGTSSTVRCVSKLATSAGFFFGTPTDAAAP